MKLTNFFKKENVKVYKLFLFLAILLVLFFCLSVFAFKNFNVKSSFEKSLINFQKLNEKNIFSIDKIYLFSSAYAENNSGKQPIWNLNLHQYTDFAIYINNHSNDLKNIETGENTVKQLNISNIKFNNTNVLGSPNLYYKNIYNFGKYEKNDTNLINEGLSYSVTTSNISYDKPQIYSNGSNPITLSYLNNNIKTNYIVNDSSITFDGSLLKKCSVPLSDIKNSLSFTITIVNGLDQVFTTNVFIDIPLSSDTDSIYNGYITSILEKENLFRFYRK